MFRSFIFSLLLLVMASALFNSVYCQEITYDYSTGKIKDLCNTVMEGKSITFTLKNINPFYYNIKINQIAYSLQAPAISIFSSDLINGKADLSTLTTKSVPNSTIKMKSTDSVRSFKTNKEKADMQIMLDKLIQNFNQKKELFREIVKIFNDDLNNFNNYLKIGNDIIALTSVPKIDGEIVRGNIKEEIKGFFKDKDASKLTLQDFRDTSQTYYDKIVSLYDKIGKSKDTLYQDSLKVAKIKEIKNDPSVQELNSQKKQINKIFDQCTVSYNKLIKIGRDGCDSQSEKAGTLYLKVLQAKFETASTIQATSLMDLIKFSPVLIPIDTNNKDTVKNFCNWEVIVTNGFRLDYSTGVIISGLTDGSFGVVDTIYRKTKIVNNKDTVMTINGKYYYKNQESRISYSLVSMMHLYWRANAWLGIGANIGIGLRNGVSTNIQFLGGASLIIGREQRFLLNGGVIVGTVKRIDDYYETHHVYETTSNTVPLIDKTKFSWYVGLTYSLGTRKEVTK